jgi:hypothetical protein
MDTYKQDKNGLPTIQKRATSQLDYPFDWNAWLAQIGDQIATYSVSVPDGITKAGVMMQDGFVTVWLDGGRVGYKYPVRCDIATASNPPRKDSRTIVVEIIA